MQHRLIDGRAFAAELLDAVRAEVADLRSRGREVGIATVLVGDDYAASVYQRRIDRHAREAGVLSRPVAMPADATFGEVVGKIAELDVDPAITGILVLRPLPAHLDDARVSARLPTLKGVEAQHPEHAGLLALGMPRFVPSTPAAAFHMLDRYMVSIGRDPRTAYDGLDLVLVGRSNNVGKPAAILGLQRNATVISAHKHTYDAGRLAAHTARADILIVAAGVPGLIGADHVRPGAIVVDIGINPVTGPDGTTKLVGDVDTDAVLPQVRAVSPVPGGVGPITDAWVLRNTVVAGRALAAPAAPRRPAPPRRGRASGRLVDAWAAVADSPKARAARSDDGADGRQGVARRDPNQRHQGEDECPFASTTTSRRSTPTASSSRRATMPQSRWSA